MAYTKDPPTYGRKPPCYGPQGGIGDVGGDGRVAGDDLAILTDASTGDITLSNLEKGRADLDGNGQPADGADLAILNDYINGDINTFPVCAKKGYPTTPPTYGKTPPCYGPYGGIGDIAGDGRVDAADRAIIMDASVGDITLSPREASRGDLDGNGQPADGVDIAMLTDYMVGDITTFPVCGETAGIDPITTPDMRSLEPGTYNIVISKTGYDTVYAKITVSSTGTVTCNDVTGVTGCGNDYPRVVATGNNVKVHMAAAGTAPTGKCGWIVAHNTANVTFISDMILAYNNLKNIGFTVSVSDISDGILMYNNLATPSSQWGC